MADVRIEIYSELYQREVGELIVSIQHDEFGVPITLDDQPDLKNIPSFYQKGNGNFWIALYQDKVVGTIALIDIGNAQVALRKMFVHKAFRGKTFSTGQLLFDTANKWMESHRVKEVFLGTLDLFQAAIKFYMKNGFTQLTEGQLPESFPRMGLDTMFFAKQISASPSYGISIFEYSSEYQPWFEKLNRDWIEKYFWMEPVDIDVLQGPEEHIVNHGGRIIMATYEKEVAGTVALKFVSDGIYEFTKMAVDGKFQGKKIGQALADAAIDKARELGGKKIILYSNTKLTPAISLYRKIGFKEVPLDGPYKRSDIKMELIL
jgi:N-acetylglutamate synthase-like GNAT family acetyltransferase